jgi:hypothetical protein
MRQQIVQPDPGKILFPDLEGRPRLLIADGDRYEEAVDCEIRR